MEPVILLFRLPPTLAPGLAPGRWHPSLHKVTVTIDSERIVAIKSDDAMETYARRQAFEQLGRFLRSLPRPSEPVALRVVLTSPARTRSHPGRPEHYAVSVGARVSAVRSDDQPMLFEEDFAPALTAAR